MVAYQQRFLRNPLVTETAGVDTYNADKIILETLEIINERKGDGKEVLRLREEKARLLKLFSKD